MSWGSHTSALTWSSLLTGNFSVTVIARDSVLDPGLTMIFIHPSSHLLLGGWTSGRPLGLVGCKWSEGGTIYTYCICYASSVTKPTLLEINHLSPALGCITPWPSWTPPPWSCLSNLVFSQLGWLAPVCIRKVYGSSSGCTAPLLIMSLKVLGSSKGSPQNVKNGGLCTCWNKKSLTGA